MYSLIRLLLRRLALYLHLSDFFRAFLTAASSASSLMATTNWCMVTEWSPVMSRRSGLDFVMIVTTLAVVSKTSKASPTKMVTEYCPMTAMVLYTPGHFLILSRCFFSTLVVEFIVTMSPVILMVTRCFLPIKRVLSLSKLSTSGPSGRTDQSHLSDRSFVYYISNL